VQVRFKSYQKEDSSIIWFKIKVNSSIHLKLGSHLFMAYFLS